jgi:hypothetical protein
MADLQVVQISLETLKTVKTLMEPSQPWIPVIAAILGAAVGGLVPIFVRIYEEYRARKINRNAVANQIYAEISALLEIIDKRQYLQDIQMIVNQLTVNPNYQQTFQIQISEDISQMYKINLDRLPLLNPSLQTKIVKFYRFLDALVQDVKPGGVFNISPITIYGAQQFLLIANEAITLGQEIKLEISNSFNLA